MEENEEAIRTFNLTGILILKLGSSKLKTMLNIRVTIAKMVQKSEHNGNVVTVTSIDHWSMNKTCHCDSLKLLFNYLAWF